MRDRAAFAAYDGLLALSLIPLLPLFALHPRLRGGLSTRFGSLRRLALPVGDTDRPVWFHGSSAGDVAALLPLVERMVRRGLPVALSTWTRSGETMAARRGPPDLRLFRLPFDLTPIVRRVVERLRPRLIVLECLELWPNLIDSCIARGVPVALVNGRLSTTSLRRFGWGSSLFEPCFRHLSFVSALDEQQAGRFVAAGTPAERVMICSSSKHALLPAEPRWPGRTKLVLGSLHREEEDRWLPVLASLHATVPGLEVVLAPRYPHRGRQLARRLRRAGLSAALASHEAQSKVLVLDQIGQLARHYRDARVAFVGGSLVPRGTHNVVEPAARGVPVLVGPHSWNCRAEVEQLVAQGGAVVVESTEALERRALELLCQPALSERRGRAARRVARKLAGAVDRIDAQLERLLESPEDRARGVAPSPTVLRA